MASRGTRRLARKAGEAVAVRAERLQQQAACLRKLQQRMGCIRLAPDRFRPASQQREIGEHDANPGLTPDCERRRADGARRHFDRLAIRGGGGCEGEVRCTQDANLVRPDF